ncbi:DUF1806 family protein [Marinicrinis lubricantis]|uniref:DUF1806 family protein n=1 Tax=Marinicrinis lubricantis TaxID=2086470 RepID=A0ABW1INF8_9BACL
MHTIQGFELQAALRLYEGQNTYLHIEAIPGCFVRNVQATITKCHVAGSKTYRVALQLSDGGWVRVEGLTHWVTDEQGRLIIAGHDELGRLTSGLELSLESFPA